MVSSSSLLLVLVVQILWGGLSLAVRYLLVYAPTTLDSAALLAMSRLVAMIVLGAASSIPGTTCSDPGRTVGSSHGEMEPLFSSSKSSQNSVRSGRSTKSAYKTKLTQLRLSTAFGAMTALSHVLNITSMYYAPVYIISFLKLLSPVFTPLADKAVLGSSLPPTLWYAVLATSFGSCLMVCGEMLAANEEEETAGGASPLLGAAIQVLSLICLTVTRLLMKSSEKKVAAS